MTNMLGVINYSFLQMWEEYIESSSVDENTPTCESLYFCDNKKDADECADLVVDEIKRDTSTSTWWFETNNEELPKIGNVYILTNWEGKAKAIIRNTHVDKIPFNKMIAEFDKKYWLDYFNFK